MMVSTKGRYALRLMIDLAQHADEGAISLKAISERQSVSMKYLEAIAAMLNRGELIRSVRGKEGGYLLSRPANEISVAEVMSITEGSLAPVACNGLKDASCDRAGLCLTFPMWQKLDALIENYLSGVSIADLIERKV